MSLEVGDRIIVQAGPWPERHGCHGRIVTGEAIYPYHGITKHEVVILLDADPLYEPYDEARPFSYHAGHNEWSCVICRRDLVPE